MLLRQDPVLKDVAEVRKLSGLSGATVYLCTRDGRHWFVRKAAANSAASGRLRLQAAKQTAFHAVLREHCTTPRVLDEGESDGRFYFDMEFIPGPDGASYLRRASYAEVAALADRLCRYVRSCAEQPPLQRTEATLFDSLFAKIVQVQRNTGLLSAENLADLFLGLESLRRLGQVPATLCHGDLTLQNMIVLPDGGLCLVDLLDAPFEHYWQDIAKLHQDLSGGWFLLNQAPVAQCVLDFLRRRLFVEARALHPGYPRLHSLLLACTFVRILPYAQNDQQRDFVAERVSFFAKRSLTEADS